MLRATRNSSGFSLIEVLAALFILGAALTAAIGLISSSLKTVRKAEVHAMGTVYARSLLQEALATEDISTISAPDALVPGYSAQRSVAEVDTMEGVAVYEVTVTVSWGTQGSVTLRGRKAALKSDE